MNVEMNVEMNKQRETNEIYSEFDETDENEKLYKWLAIGTGIIWILSIVLF